MKNRHDIGKSKNGMLIWFDPVDSHAATHIGDIPALKDLAAEVIEQLELSSDYVQTHVDLGRTVGNCDLVENHEGDEIVYAKRLNRDEYTVFNKSRGPEPSSLVTVALEKQEDGTYKLVSTWIGPSDSPSFPGTKRETSESKDFWTKHSLAWGRQAVQPGTETNKCPW
jgi:hypothetical protein